jgi:hypothetical protein
MAKARKPVSVQKATFWVRPEVLERARNTVAALDPLTLTEFVEGAFLREIKRLERAHNAGQPFPVRTGQLRRGSRAMVRRPL